MWAILTDPAKQNNAWDEAEFFATGVHHIASVMSWVRWVLPLLRLDRTMDFGCGIGRLTQALAGYAGHVIGVDIAPTMIELARQKNRRQNAEFVCNGRGDLSLFADSSLDFVYTSITLQHIPPAFARAYMIDFFRIVKPGGAVCFQLPTATEKDRSPLHKALRLGVQRATSRIAEAMGKPSMEMHGYEEDDVRRLCLAHGMSIVALRPTSAGGPGWQALEYLAVKQLAGRSLALSLSK